jgi:hypothetical protein
LSCTILERHREPRAPPVYQLSTSHKLFGKSVP